SSRTHVPPSRTRLHLPPFITPLLPLISLPSYSFFFFFNAPATTEIYTLSLHDGLPIFTSTVSLFVCCERLSCDEIASIPVYEIQDRKSTRLNSSHVKSSYAVFCLKKKKKKKQLKEKHNISTMMCSL